MASFAERFHKRPTRGRHGNNKPPDPVIRTRDPHLDKVVLFVRAVDPSPPLCGFVHPVSISSTQSAPVVEGSTISIDSRVEPEPYCFGGLACIQT